MTKRIPLTRGQFALVDDEDYDYLMQWKWHSNGQGYAVRMEARPHRRVVLMHRVLLDAPTGTEVDHANRNRLDNRRANLRLATKTQNMRNAAKRTRAQPFTSHYKGVLLHKQAQRWRAVIKVNKRQIHLGFFDSEEAAARAYNQAALTHFGTFARVNEVPS